jgi:hypothetical protein
VKDFKRVVRERAAKTGESYTAARRALVGTAEAPDDLAFTRDQLIIGPLDGWWGEFRPLLNGLSDGELLWEPAPGGLGTIGSRLTEMTHLLRMRTNAHFGDRRLTWLELETTAHAVRALELLDGAFSAWVTGVRQVDPRRLVEHSEGPPRMIDGEFAFLQVLLHTTQLLLPAGGQVLLLRQLFARS